MHPTFCSCSSYTNIIVHSVLLLNGHIYSCKFFVIQSRKEICVFPFFLSFSFFFFFAINISPHVRELYRWKFRCASGAKRNCPVSCWAESFWSNWKCGVSRNTALRNDLFWWIPDYSSVNYVKSLLLLLLLLLLVIVL